jgi:hypothetical protein
MLILIHNITKSVYATCIETESDTKLFVSFKNQYHMAGGHGGRRRNAGRKPGAHVTEVKTLRSEARKVMTEIIGSERDPLFVCLDIATNESYPPALRLEAALGSLPYLHPRLSAAAVMHTSQSANASDALSALLDRLGRLAPAPAQTIEVEPEHASEAA